MELRLPGVFRLRLTGRAYTGRIWSTDQGSGSPGGAGYRRETARTQARPECAACAEQRACEQLPWRTKQKPAGIAPGG